MARSSQSDAEIRTILAEEFDISIEDEIEYHDYISLEDDGDIDGIVPGRDISDEELEDYQIFTEQTLVTYENPSMNFAAKNKTEKCTSNPQTN